MQELPNMKKLRGRNAIEAAHAGMSGEDEARLESAQITMLTEFSYHFTPARWPME
jgi:hypothetical protein